LVADKVLAEPAQITRFDVIGRQPVDNVVRVALHGAIRRVKQQRRQADGSGKNREGTAIKGQSTFQIWSRFGEMTCRTQNGQTLCLDLLGKIDAKVQVDVRPRPLPAQCVWQGALLPVEPLLNSLLVS
jgi:hypothetical protein